MNMFIMYNMHIYQGFLNFLSCTKNQKMPFFLVPKCMPGVLKLACMPRLLAGVNFLKSVSFNFDLRKPFLQKFAAHSPILKRKQNIIKCIPITLRLYILQISNINKYHVFTNCNLNVRY